MYMDQFRTKFKKVFDKFLVLLKRDFDSILSESPAFVCGLLWKLTYDPCNYFYDARYNILATWYFILGDILSDSQNVILLRNEIRYQYSRYCPNFLSPEHPLKKEVQQSWQNLSKASDEITAYIVYNHCLKFSDYTHEEIERCLFLLKSPNANLYFGGIRTLGFGQYEADYLKPFASTIFDLLKAIVDAKDKTTPCVQEICTEYVAIPNITAGTEKFSSEEDVSILGTNTSSEQNTPIRLIPEEILKHQDLFKKLEGSLESLEEAGFLRAEVLQRLPDILQLINAAELF